MNTSFDGNEIIERLSAGKRDDREKVSLYLSKSLYEEFKKACKNLPASVVAEELMEVFVVSLKRPKKST